MNNVDSYQHKYFGKTQTTEYKLTYPVKKSDFITKLRKIGDELGQYVVNVYYLDTLYGDDEIYSEYNNDLNDYCPVYSYYHSECDYCQKHVEQTRKNLIVGFKIYPENTYPENTYKQRVQNWKKYKL